MQIELCGVRRGRETGREIGKRERESQESLKNVVRPGQVAVPAAPPPAPSMWRIHCVCANETFINHMPADSSKLLIRTVARRQSLREGGRERDGRESESLVASALASRNFAANIARLGSHRTLTMASANCQHRREDGRGRGQLQLLLCVCVC